VRWYRLLEPTGFSHGKVQEMGVVDDEGTDEKHTLISSGVFEDLKIEIRQLFV
jgi:hypothetical protein